MSRFAVSRNRRGDGGQQGDLPAEDDPKMEAAMESLMQEAEGLDENDPRQLARMMRKLQQTAGLPMDAKAEEALHGWSRASRLRMLRPNWGISSARPGPNRKKRPAASAAWCETGRPRSMKPCTTSEAFILSCWWLASPR